MSTAFVKVRDSLQHFEHKLGEWFGKWGEIVAVHPGRVIIASFTIALLCGIGVLFIQPEERAEYLYAPQGTKSWKNWRKYVRTWDKRDDDVWYQLFIASNKNKNLYTRDELLKIQTIHEDILALEFTHDGVTYTYEDICYEAPSGRCSIDSILQFFDFNRTTITNNFDDIYVGYPVDFSFWSDETATIPTIVGTNPIQTTSVYIGNDTEPTTAINYTTAYSITYYTDETKYGEKLVSKWEDEYLDFMENLKKNSDDDYDLRINYDSETSFDSELANSIASDVGSFTMAIILICCFSAVVLLRVKRRAKDERLFGCCSYTIDEHTNRFPVAFFGVFSTALAILTSFGLVGGLFGIRFNPVVSIAPFLLIGLGVDDMFVLVRAYELTNKDLTIKERMSLTMSRGGVSILFTSVTDLLAFCIGSSSIFGAVQSFCLYCGFGIFLDFLFQVSFFLAFLAIHSRQQINGTYKDIFNGKLSVSNTGEESTAPTNPEKVQSTSVLDTKIIRYDVPDSDNKIMLFINEKETSKLMEQYSEVLLSSFWLRIGLLFMFGGYLVGSVFGLTDLDAEQKFSDLAPKTSFLIPYYKDFDKYFSLIGPPIDFNINKKNLNYYDPKIRNKVYSFVNDTEEDKCFRNPSLTVNWLESYNKWLDNNDYDIQNETQFVQVLKNDYLVTEEGTQYRDDVWFNSNNNNNTILRSRVFIQMKPLGTSTKKISRCIPDIIDLTNDYKSLDISYYFANGNSFVFAHSDLLTLEQTLINLGVSCGAALFITIILIPYPIVSLYVMITVLMILIGVLGYMSLWNLPINTTTLINVVISVGFSVDNSAHFCHSYMSTPLAVKNKNSINKLFERTIRIRYALNAVGLPILYGDISTIIALLPLSTAQSEIFTSFFKIIFLVMIFGIAHGLIFLPVLFSFVGPTGIAYQEYAEDDNQETNDTTTDGEDNKVTKVEMTTNDNKAPPKTDEAPVSESENFDTEQQNV